MDHFNNGIDLVDMNENEKENRSVDSDNAELAPKHFTRMSRKPIAVHSSSEGEEQNSFAKKVPAMPSKRHAKKFTKGSDKNEQGSNRRFDYDYKYERDQERGRLRRNEDSSSQGNGKQRPHPTIVMMRLSRDPPKRRNSHASVLVDVEADAVQDSQKSDITVVD